MGALQQLPAGFFGTSTPPAGLPVGVAAALSGLGQSNPAVLPFANQGTAGSQQPTVPLTASNLSYLSLQNQLIQSQATIAKLLAYQKQMGLPPMPVDQLPPVVASVQHVANQDK
jgi:hypothetical protein